MGVGVCKYTPHWVRPWFYVKYKLSHNVYMYYYVYVCVYKHMILKAI